MTPFYLVREGTEERIAQGCAKCGRVYQLGDSFAERCCDPRCSDCGAPATTGWTVCDPCRTKRETQREIERALKATTVNEADYKGPVFCEGYGDDGYCRDIDEFRESWESREDEETPLPEYVWSCSAKKLQIPDAVDIIADVARDSYEDAEETLMGSEGFAQLDAAIIAFNASVTAEEWTPDYRCRVLLAPPTSRCP